jgi:cell division protein FtsN
LPTCRRSRAPEFDFYTLLPEKEVVIPDAALDAQARAEAAQAQALEAERAERAKRQRRPVSPRPPMRSRSTAIAPASPPTVPPVGGVGPWRRGGARAGRRKCARRRPHYVIQAGAFLGSNEAEALKAKIALTGEIARVEVAQIKANTVHRVRMGRIRMPPRWPPRSRRWPRTASTRKRSRSSRRWKTCAASRPWRSCAPG